MKREIDTGWIRPQTLDRKGMRGRLGLILALCGSGLLTACATTPSEPVIVVKEVKVPIVQPCPIDTTAPAFVDTLDALKAAAARGSDAVVALLIGGRSQRDAQIAGLKAQAEACGG